MKRLHPALLTCIVCILAACASAARAHAPRTVEIRMISDEKGNRYDPAWVEVKRGDVLHFVLVGGIHNAHFTSGRNPGRVGLPPPTPILNVAGQTADIRVDLAPGEYAYQCDPHIAFGMFGQVAVKK